MNTDEHSAPRAILTAIVAITKALAAHGISKDKKNQQQGYNFRGVEDVYEALAPLLVANNVVIVPTVRERIEDARETKSGGTLYSVKCLVDYDLYSAIDGSSVRVSIWGEAMDSGDKATNKSLSASYKYMAFQTFCIPVTGTLAEDADRETPESSKPAPKAPAKLAPKAPATPKGSPALLSALAAIAGANTIDSLLEVGSGLKNTMTSSEETRARADFFARKTYLVARDKILAGIRPLLSKPDTMQAIIEHCGTQGIVLTGPQDLETLDIPQLEGIEKWLGHEVR